MQLILGLLTLPFLYINYKIVYSDLKYKIIPNKFLGYLIGLIPLYYLYLYISPQDIALSIFFIQIFITFIISFLLYYFGIWSAGDAKYMLVLSLFIPTIGVIPLIGNIALLTLGYLLIYFIYFYFGKCIFSYKYSQSIYWNIKNDLHDKLIVFLQDENNELLKKNIIKKIFTWFLTFSLIFVSIRFSRILFFHNFFENGADSISFIQEYISYFLFTGILLLFGLTYVIRIGYKKIDTKYIAPLKTYIVKKYGIPLSLLHTILLTFLSILLLGFILYEYSINKNQTLSSLKLIFTYYLFLRISIKILFYSYKITFQIAEQDYIKISSLTQGDIIDKEYLIKIFGEQDSLGKDHVIKSLGFPTAIHYFQSIENPIDTENIKILKKIYNIVNKTHKTEKTTGFTDMKEIKILKTFAFGGYIFVGFLITYLFGNSIMNFISGIGIEFIKSIYK